MSLRDAIVEQIPWGDPRKRAASIQGLGTALEATRRDRLLVAAFFAFAALMIVSGLAGVVRVLVELARGTTDTDSAILQLVAIPLFFFGIATLVGVVTRRRAYDFVAVFEHGIAIADRRGVRLFPWSDVAAMHEEIADLVSGMSRRPHDTYRVVLRDGSIHTWNWEFERHREVGLCCRATLDRWLASRR